MGIPTQSVGTMNVTFDEPVGSTRELLNAEHKASSPDSSNVDGNIAQDEELLKGGKNAVFTSLQCFAL